MGNALTIVVVIANHHLLGLAVLAHFAPKVLVEGVEVVLQLARVHLVLGVVGRVLVEVGQEDGLRVRGLDVLAAAAVAVAAGADLVVEGAVDFVLLGAEDGGEVAVFWRGFGQLFLLYRYMVWRGGFYLAILCGVYWTLGFVYRRVSCGEEEDELTDCSSC